MCAFYDQQRTLNEYIFKYQNLRDVGKHMDREMGEANAMRKHSVAILKQRRIDNLKRGKNHV
jgi:hypothetical protein